MLADGVDTIADDVVEKLGAQAINAVLEWVDSVASISPQALKPTWRRALASRPRTLLNWLRGVEAPHEATVAFVASLLDPNSQEVRSFGAHVWLRFAATAPHKLDHGDLIRTMAFSLALAFNNPGLGAEKLAAQVFETVHEAAENNELDDSSWLMLKNHVPSLSWWGDWDKCERLRRALVDKFIRYDWSIDGFLEAVNREKTFRQIVASCKTTESGKAFLRSVVKLIAENKVHVTDAQRAVLAYIY